MVFEDGAPPSWQEFRRQLAELEVVLVPYRVPSPDELERHELSVLTFGRIQSSFERMIRSGGWIYAQDSERRILLETISWELGFTNVALGHRPAFFPIPRRIDWELIRTSIREENLSIEFAVEWGRLQHIAGRYLELVYNSRRVADEVGQAIAGKTDSSTLIQRHWYAGWVERNSGDLRPRRRATAEQALARVCFRIHTGGLRPTPPYPAKWFSSMLEAENGEPGESLKTTYTRLTVAQLGALLTSRTITAEVLPPLTEAGFARR
jgi:hypothetical protein